MAHPLAELAILRAGLRARPSLPAKPFREFLRQDVFLPQRSSEGVLTGVTQWQWWPVHDEIIKDLETEPLLIVLKARQISWSYTLAALHLYSAMTIPNYLGGVFSSQEKAAWEFLDKARFIHAHIPGSKPNLSVNNNSELQFEGSGGRLLAFPSTRDAGRGYTFNRVTVDEAAFHQHAQENYAAYMAAAEHGQIIIISSAGNEDQQVVNPWYQTMWQQAIDGLNGFKARFYGYDVRPGRDQAWLERTKLLYAANPSQFSREYPDTPETAFRSMLALRFDLEAIERGHAEATEPITAANLPQGIETPYLKIWSTPRPGIPYVAYTDAAEAKGQDYTVTGIMESRTLRHVATLRDNVLEPTQHGALAEKLARWYNEALWGVERNRGEAILYAVGQSGYPRVYWHEEERTERQIRAGREATKRIGFPITEHTRVGLIDDLAEAILDGSLSSPDSVFWAECGSFIVTEGGRAEAAGSRHDDYVMMMAGLVRMARQPSAQRLRAQTKVSMRRQQGWAYPAERR